MGPELEAWDQCSQYMLYYSTEGLSEMALERCSAHQFTPRSVLRACLERLSCIGRFLSSVCVLGNLAVSSNDAYKGLVGSLYGSPQRTIIRSSVALHVGLASLVIMMSTHILTHIFFYSTVVSLLSAHELGPL